MSDKPTERERQAKLFRDATGITAMQERINALTAEVARLTAELRKVENDSSNSR